MNFPVPPNEQKRLEALHLYEALDTEPEAAFDDIALIAAETIGVPTALVSLIDERRQWFKAKIGFAADEVPREETFCTYTILGSDAVVIEDATRDPRFTANPHVLCEGGVRFYVGVPIVNGEGHALGSLCVVDQRPRTITKNQVAVLTALARTAMRLFEERRMAKQLAEALTEVKTIQGLLPMCCSCKSIRNDQGYWAKVEEYLTEQTDAQLSHGVCPGCMQQLYPEQYAQMQAQEKSRAVLISPAR